MRDDVDKASDEGRLIIEGRSDDGNMRMTIIGNTTEHGEWEVVGEIAGCPIKLREPLNKAAVQDDIQGSILYDVYKRLQRLEKDSPYTAGVAEERARIVAELRAEADHKEAMNVSTAETLRRLADNFEAGYGRHRSKEDREQG